MRAVAAAIAATLGATLAGACGTLQSADDGSTQVAEAGAPDGASARDAEAEAEAGASPYRAVVLADHPILYYRLGEPGGAATAADSVTPAHDGTYERAQCGAPGAITGDPDTAVTFDGTTRVHVPVEGMPDFTALHAFSLEVWAKPRVAPTNFAHLVTKESTSSKGRQGYALLIDIDQGYSLERFVDGQNPKAMAPTRPAAGTWAHVVGTYDGAVLTLFVDGAIVQQTPADTSMVAQPGVEGVIGTGDDGTKGFDGDLDEVAVYDYALPAARVRAHHDQSITRP